MNFAYADPPYIGQAKAHYSEDPRCAEVDHKALIQTLERYDSWPRTWLGQLTKSCEALLEVPVPLDAQDAGAAQPGPLRPGGRARVARTLLEAH